MSSLSGSFLSVSRVPRNANCGPRDILDGPGHHPATTPPALPSPEPPRGPENRLNLPLIASLQAPLRFVNDGGRLWFAVRAGNR